MDGSPRKPAVIILAGVRWDFLWQRHQTLATLFAEAGYPTVFVETTGLATPRPNGATLRKIAARLGRAGSRGSKAPGTANLTVYSPLAAPPTHSLFRGVNRRLLLPKVARDLRRRLADPGPVIIAYPPTRTTLDLASALKPRLLHYDCSDDYAGFQGIPADIAATEREMLERADLVTCTSAPLLEKARAVRPDALPSGPGVDYERFAALQGDHPARDVQTVCYFGDASRDRLDFAAIRAVAGAGFRVRLVGGLRGADRDLLTMPGVEHLGEVPHAELPEALAGADAFIFPYRLTRLTRSISPAKTYEALATARPVVASPLPALAELDRHVYLADGPEEFVEVLRGMEELETEEKVRARIEAARRNSWESRFRDLEAELWRGM